MLWPITVMLAVHVDDPMTMSTVPTRRSRLASMRPASKIAVAVLHGRPSNDDLSMTEH